MHSTGRRGPRSIRSPVKLHPKQLSSVYFTSLPDMLVTPMSVFVEATSALPAEPTGVHHFDQQRTRSILRVPQSFLHHAHDVATDIESDKVRQSQRSHRMRHP